MMEVRNLSANDIVDIGARLVTVREFLDDALAVLTQATGVDFVAAAQGMPREARRREGGSGPSGLASPVAEGHAPKGE